MNINLRRFRAKMALKAILLLLTTPTLSAQTDTLRLIFAGDIMGHTPQIKSAEVVPNKTYNYEPCFRYVKPLLERADLAIGNLELTLPGKGPYTGYPMFRSPDALAEALKNAGFDILVTANNHSNDARGTGVTNTIETLRKNGFQHTGTFRNQRERDAYYPLMVYKDGFKIAILNYTYGTNGIPTEAPTIVNLIDTIQIRKDLDEALARKPHYIIAIMHWGLEYQLTENAEQHALARFIVRHGADMIIGAHPHVVQPTRMESVKMPDGSTKEALVVYSLGNFISNQRQAHTDGGLLYQVELLKTKGNPKPRLGTHGYIPIWRYMHQAGGKTTYYALPIARLEANPQLFKDMAATAKQNMLNFAQNLRKRLGPAELKP